MNRCLCIASRFTKNTKCWPIGPGAAFGVDQVLQHILDAPEPDRLAPGFEAAGREDRE